GARSPVHPDPTCSRSSMANHHASTGFTGFTRRDFLRSTAVAAGGLSLAACSNALDRMVAPASALFKKTGNQNGLKQIEHVIVVMMENRSFDHFLGWLPRADGRQAGLVYPDKNGSSLHTFSLAPDFQGCGFSDPDHSFVGGRVEYNGGAC